MVEECPGWDRSLFSLIPTLSIIDNVSKSTGILMLNGENDSLTPVQQAFLLQQRLTEVNPLHHKWETRKGTNTTVCFSRYLQSWLETHSGLSHSYVTTATASTIGANTGLISNGKITNTYGDNNNRQFHTVIQGENKRPILGLGC